MEIVNILNIILGWILFKIDLIVWKLVITILIGVLWVCLNRLNSMEIHLIYPHNSKYF